MSTSPNYISNGDTTGNINSAATAGWVAIIQGGAAAVGFQVVLAATGAPIGLFVFEVTDDLNPLVPQGVILGATALTLPASMAAGQPSDGAARNFLFDFNPAPSAKWIRLRYARTSGGSAAAGNFNVGLNQRGNNH